MLNICSSFGTNRLKIKKMTPSEFQAKVTNASNLDFGTVFNHSIELFKKSWLQGFLMQLFIMVLMIPFFLILYVPLIMTVVSQSETGNFDPEDVNFLFEGLSVAYMILFIIGIVIVGGIQTALTAAFYRILRNLDYGQQAKTSDLFYFLKGEYLGKILLLILASVIIAIPAVLLFYLPFIYVIVPMSFFAVVFAFNPDWTVSDIVGSSFRLGNKKWLLTFGLLIVTYMLLMILTTVTCGLGSLFVGAFLYHPLYFVYKQTVGFDELSELDKIGQEVVF